MSVCNDKVCRAKTVCKVCESITPKVCGKGGLYIPKDNCGAIYFKGVDNVTILADTEFDLADGVTAYDGRGTEIPFTVVPSEIDTSKPRIYTVRYTASGASDNIVAYFCGGKPRLHLTDCGTQTKTVTRTITVKAKYAVVCESKVCDAVVAC